MSADDTMAEPPVRYDVEDAVATITLNRPQAMNSLDTPTKERLLECVLRAAEDPSIRCVVLTGTGRAFCVGQDLREHAANLAVQSVDEVWSTVERHYAPTVLAIHTMDKPVIAAVNGVGAGAGMSLALACDLRICADTASFNSAFTAIGLSCDTGISWTLPRLVGTTRAMELLLMPRKVDAAEALDIGLVTSVVPAAELADTAATLAATPCGEGGPRPGPTPPSSVPFRSPRHVRSPRRCSSRRR